MEFKKQMRRMLSTFLAGTFVVTSVFSGESLINLQGNAGIEQVEASSYNLADSCQEGTILHCFDWTYNDIKAELPGIAEAGFTSIQTSPATPSYDPGNDTSGDWYWLYQPLDFKIATSSKKNPIGTKKELKALCDEAEKYGIKIIVDVVANHLAGSGDKNTISSQVTWSGKNNSKNWHNMGKAYYTSRKGITLGHIGMPDLNSSRQEVIDSVKGYIQELKSVGVDGIRFDAAKHIETPEEGDLGGFGVCNFWKEVPDSDMYNYGEILVGPTEGGSDDPKGVAIMQNYTKYISVTDSAYSNACLEQIVGNRVISGFANWGRFKNGSTSSGSIINPSKLVYWAESHDTYSNDGEYGPNTSNYSTDKIDRAYALVASRNAATSLYFSRPSKTKKKEIHAGVKGSTHYKTTAVAEVNKFHNVCNGNSDYYATNSDLSAASITRKNCNAFVVVKASGSGNVSVPNGGGYCTPGIYTDKVSGNTFKVTSSTITGTVGNSGIAVVYDEVNDEPIVSATPGTAGDTYEFTASSVELTLKAANVSKATYQLNSDSEKTYKSGDKITIGSDLKVGQSVTLTLNGKAKDSTHKDAKLTYTFKKIEKVENIAYLKKPSGWGSTIYCYAYDSDTESVNNGKWPGQKMKYDSATDLYSYTIDESIKKPRVIFYYSDSKRTPADMEKGYLFKTDGSWKYEKGTWSKIEEVKTGTVTVNYVCDSETLDTVTLTGKVGEAYQAEEKTFEGYTLASFSNNITGLFTSEAQTATYCYTKNPVKSKVTVNYVCDGEVVKSLVIRDTVGTNYSVDKTIDGYTYVSYQGSSLNSVITKTPKAITITLKKNPIRNGFIEEDGQTYYYENDVKTYAGLINIDGSYYYINSKCVRVTGKYYVSKTNGLLPRASYDFGEDGKLIF